MARLYSMTVAEYWRNYCARQFCENHLAWHECYDSEVQAITQASISEKLYKVEFSDHTTTIVAHTDIMYIQRVPGTLRNW